MKKGLKVFSDRVRPMADFRILDMGIFFATKLILQSGKARRAELKNTLTLKGASRIF